MRVLAPTRRDRWGVRCRRLRGGHLEASCIDAEEVRGGVGRRLDQQRVLEEAEPEADDRDRVAVADEALALIAAVESPSEHPIAAAIVSAGLELGLNINPAIASRMLERVRELNAIELDRDIAANLIDSYQQLWRQPFDGSSTPKTLDLPRSGKSDLGSILFDNAMFQIETAVKFAASVPTILKSMSDVIGKISDPKSRDPAASRNGVDCNGIDRHHVIRSARPESRGRQPR